MAQHERQVRSVIYVNRELRNSIRAEDLTSALCRGIYRRRDRERERKVAVASNGATQPLPIIKSLTQLRTAGTTKFGSLFSLSRNKSPNGTIKRRKNDIFHVASLKLALVQSSTARRCSVVLFRDIDLSLCTVQANYFAVADVV